MKLRLMLQPAPSRRTVEFASGCVVGSVFAAVLIATLF